MVTCLFLNSILDIFAFASCILNYLRALELFYNNFFGIFPLYCISVAPKFLRMHSFPILSFLLLAVWHSNILSTTTPIRSLNLNSQVLISDDKHELFNNFVRDKRNIKATRFLSHYTIISRVAASFQGVI